MMFASQDQAKISFSLVGNGKPFLSRSPFEKEDELLPSFKSTRATSLAFKLFAPDADL